MDSQKESRFKNDPTTARGTPRLKAARLLRGEADQLIEQIRGLLRLNFTKGDIKRHVRQLREKRGVVPLSNKTVEKYISHARKRNLQILDLNEDEALADSIALWSRKQQEAEAESGRAKEMLRRQETSYDAAEQERDEAETDAARELAEKSLQRIARVMEHLRRTITTAELTVQSCQDRIDRLRGNHAPVKIARTNTKGEDVDVPPPQPATVEKANDVLRDLVEKIKAREAGMVQGN